MALTGLQLRSNKWKSVKVTAPTAGLTRGAFYVINGLIGIVMDTVAAGVQTALVYSCPKIVVPKKAGTGITFAVGSKVYYVAGTTNVTNASTGNTLIGRATEAALATDTTAEIDMHGDSAA